MNKIHTIGAIIIILISFLMPFLVYSAEYERASVWAGQTHAKVTFNDVSFFIYKSGEEVEQGVFAGLGKVKELHYRRYEVYTISVDGKTIAKHRVLVEER